MILHLDTREDFKTANTLATTIKEATTNSVKKKKTTLQVAQIKVRLFFWNLSPTHWYDTFKDIHVDMNEFISPKKIIKKHSN
jgi:DNA-binding ferritin-like protein